ncbi:hypothetical protein EDEG_01129 [Edhazardia aedis USNM 41457]|uniref:Nucleolar protein 9 n=1 Tax=Edhazardia aedis (strain USNM 41457) TaxID=1003232 RepID=J9DAC1_EDHAE|nr:hypothetical protein EDEG_01129 [Edhazardia aedis USNM 41457]|eukprot:EJW04681.1 hypothetical protein EDEG_01129 [Edhazardia aedis USNM 41457]
MTADETPLDYFKNVEFEHIKDSEILQNIYKEIEEHYEKIILDTNLCFKLENLLLKSSYEQRIEFFKKIDISIIKTKLGSRIVENVLNSVKNKLEDADISLIKEIFGKKLVKFMSNENATFVARKFIDILVIVNSTDFLTQFEDNLVKNIHKFFKKDACLFTLGYYIKFSPQKQKLCDIIVDEYLYKEDFLNKRSFFYQDFMEFCGNKNRTKIFKKIKDDFFDFCKHEKANYVIQSLLKFDYKNMGRYYNLIYDNLKVFNRNSNIVLSLALSLAENNLQKECVSIVKEHYMQDSSDIFDSLLYYKSDSPDSKYTPLLVKFFQFSKEYNFDIIKLFLKHFKQSWLFEKNGRTICKCFLMGNATLNEKEDFIKLVKPEISNISKDFYGRQLLEVILEYCNEDIKEIIHKAIKNNNNEKNSFRNNSNFYNVGKTQTHNKSDKYYANKKDECKKYNRRPVEVLNSNSKKVKK